MGDSRGGIGEAAGNFIRGVLMGAADAIPGVSGGTIALIVGIYERLVTALSRFGVRFLRLLFKKQWGEAAREIDLGFLLVLFAGIVTGAGASLSLVHYLLEEHRSMTFAAFFGLILGSSILVAAMIRRRSPVAMLFLVLGIAGAFWLCGGVASTGSLLPVSAEFQESRLYVLLCGMIAICAMILPGISGSYILLLLGQYERITGSIKEILKLGGTWEDLIVVAIFGFGCAVGLMVFTKILRWFLARAHDVTLATLCGFMIGSLRLLWPFKAGSGEKFPPNVLPSGVGEVWAPLIAAVIGLIFVLGLHHLAKGTPSSESE